MENSLTLALADLKEEEAIKLTKEQIGTRAKTPWKSWETAAKAWR